jgi:hypothetical protein
MVVIVAPARAKELTISAVITRADGTVEDLGDIVRWHRNPFIRAWRNVVRLFARAK